MVELMKLKLAFRICLHQTKCFYHDFTC